VVTVSVGAACQVPSEKAADQTLLTLADAALYRAKAAGRNRWAATD
jgi:diguanylate cyclase (GGDEF)-like protein